MSLKIRLANDETLTYRTSYPGLGENPSHHTKCGLKWSNSPSEDDECDHLDCAIVAANRISRDCVIFLAFSLFFAVFAVGRDAIPEGFLGPAMVAFGILIIAFTVHTLYRNYQSMNELTEFRDKGSINGIKAFRI
ncbi:MAG TPA: hypothetical protein PKK11_06875 [Methanothrix sp.]|nr:hypothetical protein [Methanothrix sp.]